MTQLYVFRCADCAAEITVDAPVQEELLSAGCLYCDHLPSTGDFSRE